MKNIKTLIGSILLVALVAIINGPAAAQFAPVPIPDVSRDKVICFTMYTVQNNVMKMKVQLYPLKDGEDRFVRLEIKGNDTWKEIARADVVERGWTALLRVENWDMTRDYEYRVVHGKNAYYEGQIRKDPVDKDTIVVVAFTGNSVKPEYGGNLPKTDLVENVKKINPDLLFFSGDQVYDEQYHYSHWLQFGRDFGDITRDYPTICIPDDHDVGQPNLWGEDGKKASLIDASDGGYFADVEYVSEVQRAQSNHLPDPYDPTPIERGIGVYYTSLNIGRVSFAIIEDRKFKSDPRQIKTYGIRPDLITMKMDPKKLDGEGLELLGERQEKFLREWAADWRGVDMKVVLEQTIPANAATHHGGPRGFAYADLDSNGWPKSGRDRELRELRKGFAFVLAGDQHLATVIHHGVDDWNDSGWSFGVPSIVSQFTRYWMPSKPPKYREPGAPEYTGEYFDGLGNKMNIVAVANPDISPGDDKLASYADGFGVVRFNVKTREITMECWPRNVDVTDPASKQYPGWPRTITQEDNYARAAVAYLPEIKVTGMNNPVVQVIDESNGEIIYTIRINGNSFIPKVFAEGLYTVKVGEQPDGMKVFSGLKAPAGESDAIEVAF